MLAAPEPMSIQHGYNDIYRRLPMSIIRARAVDWVPNNPRIHVAGWIGAFVAVAAIYIAVAAIIGHIINGNGSPFVGS